MASFEITDFARRCCVCFLGIALMGLGVALTTKANLGTTPISALPYVASLGFQPSIGFFTIIFNLALVAWQVAVMRGKFPRTQYLQIPVSCMFAFFIDMWMFLLPDCSALTYAAKFAVLAVGTVFLAFGVFLEISANVVMMAGEGVVKVLAIISQKDFGVLKSCFDVTMVLLGAGLSFLLFNELRGIGVGTILSALFVGMFVKMFHSLRGRMA